MRTGRDVVIAALLGAEEFGFATAPLVATGCILMRVCHLNTCPVGVATQDPRLRAKFTGKPEHVVNFMHFVAMEMREIMAELGFRTINEMVGQSQCLSVRKNIDHWKFKHLDLSPLLYKESVPAGETLYKSVEQKHLIHDIVDRKLIAQAQAALENGSRVAIEMPIINTDRSVGTMISNEISKKYGAEGLPYNTISVKFNGSAGQSFGTFAAKGLRFELEGDANDYFGKGLSGAELVVYPPKVSTFAARSNILIGNVAFFGGTSGEAFIRGIAGERFCVRNSGVTAIVEGVGDHGCEYMTGGKAIILGETGRNFAAGMSGGVAYVLDVNGDFSGKCNMEMVQLETIEDAEESAELKALIAKHQQHTDSDVAAELLADWDAAVAKFVKVMPVDYKQMQEYMKQARATGQYESENDVATAAFDMHLANLAK